MAILCLPPPAPDRAAGKDFEEAVERRWKWLQCVEDLVRKIVLGGEGRMWLCAALGSLDLPPAAQRAAFLGLVSKDGEEGRSIRQRVIRMLCENRPAWAARVLARDDRLLRRFFEGDSQRILQWFGKFSSGGNSDHQWGARALARFTFVHRESCWHELDWNGKHGQAPATVASKPHYFLELDVLRTVDNFLDKVPSFWRSDELWDSMKNGEFLSLDIDFFINALEEKMMVDDCPETWNLVEDYLAEESLSKLSNCVLHLLSEESLLTFVNELVFQMSSKGPRKNERKGGGREKQKTWLQEVILSEERCPTLYDAIVCNACANHRRQIVKIVGDEDYEEETKVLKRLLGEAECDPAVVWAVRRQNLKLDKWSCLKFLGLEALMLYWYLTENSGQISYPLLFKENGIRSDAAPVTPRKRKKRKSRKSRKDTEDSSNSGSDDGESSSMEHKSWRLCTDNFRFLWRKEDLPEHLSGYAFDEWVRWTVAHW
ncbi:uncharacterized protein LOC112341374 [Selaginella moellendorffii]|uniref:uncharacterized protein LOC112341374 n=1 Tax=Selaginella moellendorffii TaxID=88036 RepID=UPI000D1C64FA|nr:uncharacterized protein LOC112341374 [Selaginella moellendorffii]XP_024517111.1 uncharacterized protein LOC112341374 [Selaginella moellendorffii]XP_024517112.1 uncharacterized protein LOC112341374 [Selaginella moellendorffii]|eukprot:XP_024517110.1 uncharacterized protein LOC112341374 [Selaginella moellendorffii]